MHKFKKRFSLGHPELEMEGFPNAYYGMIKQSSQAFRDEIHDIYFGKFFRYTHEGQEKKYGNCMGVEATDDHLDNLFSIQEEFGIEISLTMNQLEVPHELQFNRILQNKFVEWIGGFYDAGLRSCTIAWTHLLANGALQKRCPDMRWKNTVNHMISDNQQVVEMIYTGYDTILLDRSLNRDINELKKIKKTVDELNEKFKGKRKKILTSLLIKEGCAYRCPFKKEHDDMASEIGALYFNSLMVQNTCDKWRYSEYKHLPRIGVDMAVQNKDSLDEYLKYVDILKHSGRFQTMPFSCDEIREKGLKYGWNLSKNKYIGKDSNEKNLETDCFQKIYDNNAVPFPLWSLNFQKNDGLRMTKENYDEFKEEHLKDEFWLSDNGKKLEKILMVCKSQCYGCNKCEEAFELEPIDSILQLDGSKAKIQPQESH